MKDTRDLLERVGARFPFPDAAFERMLRRRERKERNRRISAAVLAIAIALLSVAGLTRVVGNSRRPATQPTPTPVDRGIFSGMGGWIAYSGTSGSIDTYGMWAMDPQGGARVRLSTHTGEPLAWSRDGSKLLILSASGRALSVLNADGSETLLIDAGASGNLSGGSFSPDGSEVVYANDSSASGIYVIDASGGTPRRLLKGGPTTGVSLPTFSPDGSQIAYFEGLSGLGPLGNRLRVMNADGSGSRVLLKDTGVMKGYVSSGPLAWSPDGRRLAFGVDLHGLGWGVYVVGADGSGLTRLIAKGSHPEWSPDGSHIAYAPGRGLGSSLMIANADGTHAQRFNYATSGPWNPLARAESGSRHTSGTAGATRADALTYAIAAMAAVGVVVLWLRRKRKAVAAVRRSLEADDEG